VRTFRDGGEAQVLRAGDVSESGALLESVANLPLEEGEEVELRFSELTPAPDLAVTARVARKGASGGGRREPSFQVGVRFLLDRPDLREAWGDFLSGLRRQGIE